MACIAFPDWISVILNVWIPVRTLSARLEVFARPVNLAFRQELLKKLHSGNCCPTASPGVCPQGVASSAAGNHVRLKRSLDLPAYYMFPWPLNFLRYCAGEIPVAFRKATQKLLALW